MANKILNGKVLRDQNDKTIIVVVESMKRHKFYNKYHKMSKKYHVHDEHNTYKVGDTVLFHGCRPLSKMKKWIVYEEAAS